MEFISILNFPVAVGAWAGGGEVCVCVCVWGGGGGEGGLGGWVALFIFNFFDLIRFSRNIKNKIKIHAISWPLLLFCSYFLSFFRCLL